MTDPINIKDFQHSAINQVKYLQDNAINNIFDFKGNPVKYNPFTSMTFNWQLAQMNKEYIKWLTLPFVVSESYWKTWLDVYAPKGKE